MQNIQVRLNQRIKTVFLKISFQIAENIDQMPTYSISEKINGAQN